MIANEKELFARRRQLCPSLVSHECGYLPFKHIVFKLRLQSDTRTLIKQTVSRAENKANCWLDIMSGQVQSGQTSLDAVLHDPGVKTQN